MPPPKKRRSLGPKPAPPVDLPQIQIIGQSYRHAEWRRMVDPHAVVRQLLTVLDQRIVPDALYWEKDNNQFCLHTKMYDSHKISGLPTLANDLLQILSRFQCTVVTDQNHPDVRRVSHAYIQTGRPDLLRWLRYNDTTNAATGHFHPADERQYGSLWKRRQDGTTATTWPSMTHKLSEDDDDDDDDETMDRAWDIEHSDGLDPFQFTIDQLSLQLPSTFDNSDRSTTVLLQKCWERAVTMESSQMSVATPAGEKAANETATGEASVETNEATMEETTKPVETAAETTKLASTAPSASAIKTPQMAREACQRWNLFWPSPPTNAMCPSCQIHCSSNQRWHDHYYGTNTTEGCCWVAMEKARRTFIRKCLVREVETQRRLLLQTLLSEDAGPLDAFGMCNVLETKLHQSHGLEESGQQTLQVDLHQPPMVLNHNVIDSTRSRIVERYSSVPR